MSVQYSGGCSVQWRLFSTVEGLASVLWGVSISTVEVAKYGGGLTTVQALTPALTFLINKSSNNATIFTNMKR